MDEVKKGEYHLQTIWGCSAGVENARDRLLEGHPSWPSLSPFGLQPGPTPRPLINSGPCDRHLPIQP